MDAQGMFRGRYRKAVEGGMEAGQIRDLPFHLRFGLHLMSN